MKVQGKHYRALWVKENDSKVIQIIDQTKLPHEFVILDLRCLDDFLVAIKDMWIRGAPLIGIAASYGMYIAALTAPADNFDAFIEEAAAKLKATRPTAVNLALAVDQQLLVLRQGTTRAEKIALAFQTANVFTENEVECCRKIGLFGLKLIKKISKQKKGAPVNILTHCNAGWIACIDYGSALAPVYAAFDAGINVHVWVDETRPRNQGAKLTAWELLNHGVPHHVIADNVGGHLMQHDMVDIVFVGCDRATYTGDVANKIGTYLKALAAKANKVPFYAVFPSTTFDWHLRDGVREIPIEERDAEEVRYMQGLCDGVIKSVLIMPQESPAANYGFDVTPAKYCTGLITERGICKANAQSIFKLFPDQGKGSSLDN